MSSKQGKIGIKIFMFIVTSLVGIVIHVSIYLNKKMSVEGRIKYFETYISQCFCRVTIRKMIDNECQFLPSS